MIVEDIIKFNIFYLNYNDTIGDAIKEFNKQYFKSVPVLEGGKVIGVLEMKDLLNYTLQKKNLSSSVRKIMNSKYCTTKYDIPLDQLIDIKFDT